MMTRFVNGQVLSSPHLVLTNVSYKNGISISKSFVQLGHYPRSSKSFATGQEAIFHFVPFSDLFPPFGMLVFFNQRQELRQGFFQITGQVQRNCNVLVQFGRVNIHMDNGFGTCVTISVTGYPIT